MNRSKLMDEGYTWEEAEDLLWQQAEEQADAERDRRIDESREEACTPK